ncbi:MAG: ABC transporter ATP-binding protein [Gammaproteobacteria bacterium]|jgi:putative ABC transport system ATP-binding protein|nr:ABC transporter ATP-binding protein [Gammaproteobacteria bacterium]
MIHFEQLHKTYSLGQQGVAALRNVSDTIKPAEMVALCGPSGSGKTSLLNILGLLDMDYQGQVYMHNERFPRDPWSAAEIRRQKFGFVFQRFNLIAVMTALENVAYPLQLNGYNRQQQRQLATAMLEQVGLAKFASHRPDNLSGGQQQRVAIARALVHQPKLVIADEPTASLDSTSADEIVQIMKTMGQDLGTTFIVATHDPRMAGHCERSLILTDGQLQEANQI